MTIAWPVDEDGFKARKCKLCDLHKKVRSNCVPGRRLDALEALSNPDIGRIKVLLVGEAPGAAEDQKGLPFVGSSGEELHGIFDELDDLYPDKIDFRTIGVTNSVRCRPPRS